MRSIVVAGATLLAVLLLAAGAGARYPYPPRLPAGVVPNDVTGGTVWKYAATPEPPSPLNLLVQRDPGELHGVRGASIVDASPSAATAWMKTTGRPDVTIAVLDSGIEWNNAEAMSDLRLKVRLNTGELPQPRHDRSTALGSGRPCSSYRYEPAHPYDLDGNGVVNVDDYACDRRVSLADPRRTGPPGVLTPQDLIIAFSNHTDSDHNGYVDDIAGWDFLDNDNDPYDDVQYGHGTGEARDSTAEAGNGGDAGTCPNCTVLPLRVGDSFVADSNRFGVAVTYAVDNQSAVVQEALGAIDETKLAREAVNYAYAHGVPVIASAADEAAQHHNPPGNLPHTILVNSVRMYDSTFTPEPRSYVQFNGCTNFSSKVTLSVPSSSCSSEATGKAAGMAGLLISAAKDAHEAGHLPFHPTCRYARGSRCILSANEVRQILIDGSDDISFTGGNEPSCQTRAPGCTDPFRYVEPIVQLHRPVVSPLASKSYPARAGHDQFTGYGRINARRAVTQILPDSGGDAAVPPEVEITSPDWFSTVDPRRPTAGIGAQVDARGQRYTCRVLVAPGSYPNDAEAPKGDFVPVASPWCDGTSAHTRAFSGTVASLDVAALKARFPADAGSFDGPLVPAGDQASNGRPNSEPYGFVVKVVAVAAGLTGQDRRNLYLHHDRDLLPGFPRHRQGYGDIQSTPVLADLNGDGVNELAYATGDGIVHALEPNGRELRGFPVRTPEIQFMHFGSRGFRSRQVSPRVSGAVIGALAAADLNGDGRPELVATDMEGDVLAWNHRGRRVFDRRTFARFSGAPLRPFVNVREGPTNRTQRGLLSAPVVANLDGKGGPEIIVGAMDRHVYAWHANGRLVRGFPKLVVDPAKVASVARRTDAVTFKPGVGATLNQGAIIDTPAVGDITGGGRPEIVVGTNEEYTASQDGGANAAGVNSGAISVLAGAGLLNLANSRLYALSSSGRIVPGWPAKIAIVFSELLPVVGEGMTGAPVIGSVPCAGSGAAPRVGTISDGGPAYLLNGDGTSCLGTSDGKAQTLTLNAVPGAHARDTPVVPALGEPLFARVGGKLAFVSPAVGLMRALDLAAPEYQGGQDYIAAWDPSSGGFLSGYPTGVDDLQFLTGPIGGDIDGKPGEEVAGGTAYLDLDAFDAGGNPVSGYPKLTTDWMVATPVLGTWGRGGKVLVGTTRSGFLFAWRTGAGACADATWPRFHHDPANSGDLARDAVPPGPPVRVRLRGRRLSVIAPGDDGACGRASAWRVATAGRRVGGEPAPAAVGSRQALRLPRRLGRTVSVRAVDEQGNAGPAVVLRVRKR